MKNILIPTDFSKNAWNATQYAIELFKNEDCVFHFLNTYTPTIANSRFMATTANGRVLENAAQLCSKRDLQKVVECVNKEYNNPKHNFKTTSSFSFLVDEVKEMVEKFKIDFVVTGTKGASAMEEVFLGSNTVRIIKSIKECPVLAIPQDFEFVTPKEIAFATDFNRFYPKSELEPLVSLAHAFDAVIRIVHIQYKVQALTELQQFNLSMLRKYFKDTEHYVHTISELNSVSKTLEIFSEELDLHLLVMLNYQHSYMERMTREPILKRLAFHIQIPLLVIPEIGMDSPFRGKKETKDKAQKEITDFPNC